MTAPLRESELDTYGGLLRLLAERRGDAPAIWHDGTEVTFAALDAEVDRYAKALLAAGVEHGDTVAVLAGNCPRWLYAVFAAARIGAVCVPVNTWYRESEIAFLLRHTEARVLLTVDGLLRQDFAAYVDTIAPDLPDLRLVVALDVDSRIADAMPLDAFLAAGETVAALAAGDTADDAVTTLAEREAAVTGDDLLFLLYTSGSTSDPKGVQLHHRPALVNDFHYGTRIGLVPDDRYAIFLPLFYSAVAVNMLPSAWTNGSCVVLLDAFEAGAAIHTIEASRATAFAGVGSMIRAILADPGYPQADLSRLVRGVVGFGNEDKRAGREDLGIIEACCCYGLTESYGPVTGTEPSDSLDELVTTIGRPLPGWECKIVDPSTGETVPQGEPGELRIRGYLTSGYYKNPAATAEAFDADGFYRTGDLMHIDDTGRLVFRSRLKEIVKSAGQLIAPVEVEEVLAGHPKVVQAHVFGMVDAERGEIVAAFVEAEPGVDEASLRAYLRERIAGFKVPARIWLVADHELPRVASGKVPKHLLRELAQNLQAATV